MRPPRFRNRLAAVLAMRCARPLRQPALSAIDAVLDGIVDLLLYGALARPTRRHGSLSKGDAVGDRLPELVPGGQPHDPSRHRSCIGGLARRHRETSFNEDVPHPPDGAQDARTAEGLRRYERLADRRRPRRARRPPHATPPRARRARASASAITSPSFARSSTIGTRTSSSTCSTSSRASFPTITTSSPTSSSCSSVTRAAIRAA